MKTRCKFYVSSITKHGYMGMAQGQENTQETVKLCAVYGGSPEDQSFAAATPNGDLSITVNNPNVIGTFKLGSAYYLDLTPIHEAVA